MTSNYTPQFTENDAEMPVVDPTFQKTASEQNTLPGSPLEMLRNALTEEVVSEDLYLRIPSRPTVKLIYGTDIDGEKFQLWQRRCTNRKTDAVDVIKLSSIVLANQLKGVTLEHNGKDIEVKGSDGEPLSLQHQEFRDMLIRDPSQRNVEARLLIRAVYGKDGHLMAAAKEVIEKSGYSDEIGDEWDEDPTGV